MIRVFTLLLFLFTIQTFAQTELSITVDNPSQDTLLEKTKYAITINSGDNGFSLTDGEYTKDKAEGNTYIIKTGKAYFDMVVKIIDFDGNILMEKRFALVKSGKHKLPRKIAGSYLDFILEKDTASESELTLKSDSSFKEEIWVGCPNNSHRTCKRSGTWHVENTIITLHTTKATCTECGNNKTWIKKEYPDERYIFKGTYLGTVDLLKKRYSRR